MAISFNHIINNLTGVLRVAVYANFWVAGAVWALTLITETLVVSQGQSVAVLNAAGTLVVYGFARFFEGPSDSDQTSRISAWRKNMPRLSLLSIVGGLGFSVIELIRIGSLELTLLYAVGGFFALLYPLPFVLKNKGGGLRSIPGLKLFLIAGLWAYTTAYIPAVLAEADWIWPTVERFLWTAALTIPFDARDVSLDAKQIRTLPHLIGPRNSMFLANALLWLSFTVYVAYFGMPLLTTFAVFGFFALVILLAKPNFGDLYFGFVIEGLPLLLLGFIALLPYL